MSVVAVLQARMSSRRLPGKVLKPLLGAPMMGRQIERLARSRRVDRLVVATSLEAGDDVVARYCAQIGVPCHRGPLEDVLARYVEAFKALGDGADHLVRVTADCPLADPAIIDACVDLHLRSGADYTSNTVDRTFPKGLDVEIARAPLFEEIAQATQDPYDREHVTPYFYRNPQVFKIAQLTQAPDRSYARWTVDTPSDYRFAHLVYQRLFPENPEFGAGEIEALGWTLDADPDRALARAAALGLHPAV